MLKSDNPCVTDKLISALSEVGLNAHSLESPDGMTTRVVVPILDMTADEPVVDAYNPEITAYLTQTIESWGHKGFLYLATSGQDAPCKIGAIGVNGITGEQYFSKDWQTVSSLEEAVDVFQNLWNQRDALINVFTGKTGTGEPG